MWLLSDTKYCHAQSKPPLSVLIYFKNFPAHVAFTSLNLSLRPNPKLDLTPCFLITQPILALPAYFEYFQAKIVRRSGVFIANFEHFSHLFVVFLLLTLSK